MRAHHYLGFGKSAGKRIFYVATINDEWVALLSWAAAALHIKCRDQWIGWDKAVKRRRLKQVTNNTRFLILPTIRIKNLASRVLALNLKRLRRDWHNQHGVNILLVETFVDPDQFRGTCYLAQGWTRLGLTEGFGHDPRGSYAHHGRPKLIFVRPLVRNAANRLHNPLVENETDTPNVIVDVTKLPLEDLVDSLYRFPHARARPASVCFHEAKLLALTACALLSGANGYRGLTRYVQTMRPCDLIRLGIRPERTPSLWIFWRLIKQVDARAFDQHVTKWLASVQPSTAINSLISSMGSGKSLPLLTALRRNCG